MTLAQVAHGWMRAGGASLAPAAQPKPAQPMVIEHKVLILTTPGQSFLLPSGFEPGTSSLASRAATAAVGARPGRPSSNCHCKPSTHRHLDQPTHAGFTNNDFLERTLQGYGVPFQVTPFDSAASPRLDLNALLWNPDGSARFSSLVMYPNLEAMGHLTKAEVETIWSFQRKTGARSVKFAAWPTNIGFNPNYAGCSSDATTMRWAAAAPTGVSGVRLATTLSSSGLYRCVALDARRRTASPLTDLFTSGPAPNSYPPTHPNRTTPRCPGVAATPLAVCSMWAADFADTGLHPPCTPTPILTTDQGVVGATIKYGDGRESMAFVFDCATWSTACAVVSHLAAAWMLQNIVPGERRALLAVQVRWCVRSSAVCHGRPADWLRAAATAGLAHHAFAYRSSALTPPRNPPLLDCPSPPKADDFFLETVPAGATTGFRARPTDLQRQITWQEKDLMAKPNTVAGTSIKCVFSRLFC